MIRRSLLFIFTMLTAGTLVPAVSAFAQTQTPPPSSGSIGVRLLEAPVSRANDPRARIYIVDHLSQGTTISRRMEVQNATSETQTVKLYSGAATVNNGNFVTAAGSGGDDVAEWTSVDPGQVTIAPGQSAQAVVTIVVPRGVS